MRGEQCTDTHTHTHIHTHTSTGACWIQKKATERVFLLLSEDWPSRTTSVGLKCAEIPCTEKKCHQIQSEQLELFEGTVRV